LKLTPLLLIILLCGCTSLFPPRQAEDQHINQQINQLLWQGISQLSEQNSDQQLQALVEAYPDTPQATAAAQLLNLHAENVKLRSDKSKKTLTEELEALRQENRQLQQDLEKLRRLLIDYEKRAS